jgi:hypothetical protein
MSSSTMILASQIFDPKNRFVEGRILSNSDGIIQTLPIFTWPPGVTSDEKLTFLSYFTAFGRSEDESPTHWATWMYSYIVLCFDTMEELIRRQGGREYKFEKLPLKLIKDINALSEEALNFEGSDENQEYTRKLALISFPSQLPHLPRSAEFFPDILAAGCLVQSVYGFCGLLIFLAGKKINEKNIITISERRPQNLIDTYSINEQAAFFLSGEGKMGVTAHHMVNQSWVTYAQARMAIITDVAAFAIGTTLPQRVVYTVSKMIENTGMQPAYYIHRFLQAFPECVNYACIRPSLGVYAASIREVAQADSRIQPYYKVIHGDLTRAFHRNGLLALSAVSISFEKLMAPSMKNFTLGEGATAAVNMFDMEAASKGHRTLSSVTANLDDETIGLE